MRAPAGYGTLYKDERGRKGLRGLAADTQATGQAVTNVWQFEIGRTPTALGQIRSPCAQARSEGGPRARSWHTKAHVKGLFVGRGRGGEGARARRSANCAIPSPPRQQQHAWRRGGVGPLPPSWPPLPCATSCASPCIHSKSASSPQARCGAPRGQREVCDHCDDVEVCLRALARSPSHTHSRASTHPACCFSLLYPIITSPHTHASTLRSPRRHCLPVPPHAPAGLQPHAPSRRERHSGGGIRVRV